MPLTDTAALFSDLAPFADLGTDVPEIVSHDQKQIVRMTREGIPLELLVHSDGTIDEKYGEQERRHASLKALLASPTFADLARWADSQRKSLRQRVEDDTIPVVGRFPSTGSEGGVRFFEETLWAYQPKGNNEEIAVTLIDGPAGIGKTSFIRNLAFIRADTYLSKRHPLVLHVESRGRMLQNLTDLMAFSLQTLRLKVTYDQVPPLIRHGLVMLAIDGFDELGDPNGYGLAWAQVNELIASSRGSGSIVLSGRETFVSLDRLRPVLTSLRESDIIQTFTLQLLSPSNAKRWLSSAGWSEVALQSEAAQPLFEPSSYALRPFFLSELARDGVAEQLTNGAVTNLLSFLVNAMLVREAKKFGKDIEQLTSSEDRQLFIAKLMEEVARDLAENQTEAIAADTIVWLAEVCSSGMVPDSLTGILKNRASVIAFLTEDSRRGFRRFVHEQVSNYFLSRNIREAVSDGEVPKYLRRNILSLDFLEGFSEQCSEWTDDEAQRFIDQAFQRLKEVGDYDRSKRNLATLIITASCIHKPNTKIVIEETSLDDVYVLQRVENISLKSVSINQLYAREADLRSLEFDENCHVVSLIADEGTVTSPQMPLPSFISLHDKTLIRPDEKIDWLIDRWSFDPLTRVSNDFFDNVLPQLPLFELLSRVVRTKSYWIKEDDEERPTRRILDDENWNTLREIMLKHDLLVERTTVPASGRPGTFFHVKNRQGLLNVRQISEDAIPFFRELLEVSHRMIGEA